MKFTFDLNNISEAAKNFLNFLKQNYPNYNVLAFYGEMGAGKTTFIKEICKLLDVKDNVVSPTFAIINEYKTADGKNIYHFDFYRLKNLEEALNIGVEEYFYSNELCLIEWPEIVEDLLPENTIYLQIKPLDNQQRELVILNNKN